MTDSGSTLRDATPLDPRNTVEEAEHVASLLRVRAALGPGLFIYAGAVTLDLLDVAGLAPGSLRAVIGLRVTGTVLSALLLLRLRMAPRPGRLTLRLLTAGMFATYNLIFGAMAVATEGITSTYFGGAMVVLAVYGALVSERWQRGVIDAFGPFAAYPAALLVAGLVSPSIHDQLADPRARAIFLINLGNLFIAYVIVVIAGHVSWGLRRQVFETRSLGRYKLKERIGAGGMGEVWRAHHATLQRDVAVKILAGDHALRDANAVSRFEREVHATTELVHPNTVRIYDYGVTDDGVWFYAMELLDGESLASLVAREGALEIARAVHLVLQATRALAEAHAKGIVHRDVKPENLFVTSLGGENDFVKVLDFGIAQVAREGREGRDPKLTEPGVIVGTPAWLAPETIRGGAIDARADVYGLGAVLYYALTGRAPFEGASAMVVVSAHLHETAKAPSSKRGAAIAADVEAVVMRCLAKEPGERYGSARELADALDACDVAGKWRGQAPSGVGGRGGGEAGKAR